MEENSKITFAKNMNKLNFNTTLNIPVDTNASIKTILDINSFIFDQKVECGNGKAIINGKIGTKVLYVDTDNLTNTLTFNTTFNETYIDSSVTSDTMLIVSSSSVSNNILSTDGSLKLNCDINLSLIAYINLPISNNLELTNMTITKKSELKTNTISQHINTKFEHTTNFEIKDNINKILCNNCYFTCEKVAAQDGFMIVEGKMISNLLYETHQDENIIIKEIKEISPIKCDVEVANLTSENILDLTFSIDKYNQEVSTEVADENNVVSIRQNINVYGVSLKPLSIDVVDDMFSTSNEIETTSSKREYTKQAQHHSISEIISNEVSLRDDETAIDEVLANLNIVPEITNTYIKDDNLMIEGIVVSNLTYIDENKEIKHKEIEIPYIINTKISAEVLGCVHSDISLVDTRLKVKRGTIIEVEYTLFISLDIYEKETHEMIDSFKIGKQLDFSKYDFQIFIAKPNETIWELCKRIKISPDEIHQHNKNLPLIMEGGEKVIIKR
ncbi:MAG: hypothetical protein J6Q13_04215 [Clostridia bacterium]|nr:hypothetical protein [Clostridia bacterium]